MLSLIVFLFPIFPRWSTRKINNIFFSYPWTMATKCSLSKTSEHLSHSVNIFTSWHKTDTQKGLTRLIESLNVTTVVSFLSGSCCRSSAHAEDRHDSFSSLSCWVELWCQRSTETPSDFTVWEEPMLAAPDLNVLQHQRPHLACTAAATVSFCSSCLGPVGLPAQSREKPC